MHQIGAFENSQHLFLLKHVEVLTFSSPHTNFHRDCPKITPKFGSQQKTMAKNPCTNLYRELFISHEKCCHSLGHLWPPDFLCFFNEKRMYHGSYALISAQNVLQVAFFFLQIACDWGQHQF